MATHLPQRRVGRYELIEEVGRGLTAVVYKARDSELGRIVALKTLEVPAAVLQAEGEQFQRRFFKEARVAARLSHPGLVTVHDVGRDPDSGRLFIAFEYVEGHLLESVAGNQPMDWHEALRITMSVAAALHHAHIHGVVHRDIKPASIMLNGSGEPKVLDFGVAKAETSWLKMTATGQSFGSPLYASPEQVEGHATDVRTDVFSLGAVLYRLLTAQHAFAAQSISDIMRRVLEEDPPPPSGLGDSLPEAIDDVVARALAKKPSDRYPDAKSLGEDLEDILAERAPRHALGGLATRQTEEWRVARPDGEASSLPRVEGPSQAAATAEPRLPDTVPAQSATAGDRTWLPGEQTLLRRRASLRAIAGVALLVGVTVVHFVRGKEQEPAPMRLPTPAPAAVPTPTPAPLLSEAAEEDLEKAPAETGPLTSVPGESARLLLDVEHTLKAGTLVVYANGEKLVQRHLHAAVTNTVLGLNFRRQRLREVVPIDPGKKRLLVQVLWKDGRRSESIGGTFKPGVTRRLRVRMSRLGKGLSLDWR